MLRLEFNLSECQAGFSKKQSDVLLEPGNHPVGLMLAELKEAPGILHTLNLIFLESGSLKLFRIVEKNRLNEMVEVATDDIKEPHLVIM